MKLSKFFYVAAALIAVSCSSKLKTDDYSITVKTASSDAKYVRLEVISPKIIRVSASRDRSLKRDASLIALGNHIPCYWEHALNDSTAILKTDELTAKVRLSDGRVTFFDKSGEILLSEAERSLTPISFESDKAYTIYQNWNSTPEEAFYGLGQHQGDEFNWAGRNEKLIQYNTKVTIPFLTSSKGYGILWDNYSMSRFGDARDYSQIGEIFTLYRNDGSEGALSGIYTSAEGKTILRDEPLIFLEHAKSLEENLIKDFPLKGSNVLYEGYIEPSESGEFRFMLYYSGYVRVEMGGEEVVAERWRTAWNPNTYKFDCKLEAGQKTPIRIEWKPDGDVAYCSLRVLSPDNLHNSPHIAFWSEMGDIIDYYFVKGEDLDEVVSGYRQITGKAPVMPKWSMGFWQCRERYANSQDFYDVLNWFEEDSMPIDVIIQDWFYWEEDQWGSHEFDPARFPDPQALIDSIHSMGVKYMISVWPKFYCGTEHYEEFDSKGWMYSQAVRDSIRDWVGPGYVGSFYDAYCSDARKLFWNQMNEHLYKYGVDAWWMDASEPNVRDCVDMDYWKALCNPTALGTSTKYLNTYGLMNADAIYGGQRSTNPDRRVLLLTRSGFAGIQRYSTAIWSGDIASRWEDLKAQIPAGINFSMAGVPWWSMDIGGFCVEDRYTCPSPSEADLEEWRELNTRWYQFGAFVPFFRVHGQWPYREYYNISPKSHPAYKSMSYYNHLRSELLPYIYSLAGRVWLDDYTIMRGLAMDFGGDSAALSIGDQYMFGPSIMVAPVYEYKARSRKVYFPEHQGGWYAFGDASKVVSRSGETLVVPAPYEHIPIFVPAGSLIPKTASPIRHSMEQDPTHIVIDIYPGADGEFVIYEDAGEGYEYEEGAYATIRLSWNDARRELTIGRTEGIYAGMPESRLFIINIAGASSDVEVAYTGDEITKLL